MTARIDHRRVQPHTGSASRASRRREQVEMPFAVVNGEPVTELPRDLYIPPQALEVFLEAFEGPLDLLLYLIRRQNLDILDIPLAEITRQYMRYIELMQDLQLELAGEYLVMAATLAEIKSRMLLPRPKIYGRRGRGGSARGAGAPPAGIRALQARRRGDRCAAAARARRLGDLRGAQGPAGDPGAAADHAAGDAGRLPGGRGARGDVCAPSHSARAALRARAHGRYPLEPRARELRRVRAPLPAGGGAHGRDGHLHGDPRARARGADRHRAGRALRSAARAGRDSGAQAARGRRQRGALRGRRGHGRRGQPGRGHGGE